MSGMETAAGIAGLVSLSIQLCNGLVKYHQAWSSYDGIPKVLARLKRLTDVLTYLELNSKLIESRIGTRGVPIEILITPINNLNDKLRQFLERCKASTNTQHAGSLKRATKKAVYPFKKLQVEELLAELQGLISDLDIGIHSLQLDIDLEQLRISDMHSASLSSMQYCMDRQISGMQDLRTTVVAEMRSLNDRLGSIAATQGSHRNARQQLLDSPVYVSRWLIEHPATLQAICDDINHLQLALTEQKQHNIIYPAGTITSTSGPATKARSLWSACQCRANGGLFQKTVRPYRFGFFTIYREDIETSTHMKSCPHLWVAQESSQFSVRISLGSFMDVLIDSCFNIRIGAGGSSVGTQLSPRKLRRRSSPVFEALEEIDPEDSKTIQTTLVKIKSAFREKSASPHDTNADDENALDILCYRFGISSSYEALSSFCSLFSGLAGSGVPTNEPIRDANSDTNSYLADRLFEFVAHLQGYNRHFNTFGNVSQLEALTVALILEGHWSKCPDFEIDPGFGNKVPAHVEYLRQLGPGAQDSLELSEFAKAILREDAGTVSSILSNAASANRAEEIFTFRTVDDLNVLHLSYDWADGLSLMLTHDEGAGLMAESSSSGFAPAEFAALSSSSRPLEVLLEHDNFWDSLSDLRLLEMVDGFMGRKIAPETRHLAIKAIACRRRQLGTFAQRHLPLRTWTRLNIEREEVLDGDDLWSVLHALEQAHVSLPKDLASLSKDAEYSHGTFYHTVGAVQSMDELWAWGFRDIFSYNKHGLSAFHHHGGVMAKVWLLEHGAAFEPLEGTVPGSTLWHYMGAVLGETSSYLVTSGAFSFKEFQYCWKQILESEALDQCSCHCTEQGCSPLSNFLKGFLRYKWIKRRKAPWLRQLLKSERLTLRQAGAIIRLATFQVLGLRHTCCHMSIMYGEPACRPIQATQEEREEVQEEQSELVDVFEDLITEFMSEFDYETNHVADFLQSMWAPRMYRTEADVYGIEKEQLGAQSVGVKLARIPDLVTQERSEFLDTIRQWSGVSVFDETDSDGPTSQDGNDYDTDGNSYYTDEDGYYSDEIGTDEDEIATRKKHTDDSSDITRY